MSDLDRQVYEQFRALSERYYQEFKNVLRPEIDAMLETQNERTYEMQRKNESLTWALEEKQQELDNLKASYDAVVERFTKTVEALTGSSRQDAK